VKPLQLLTQRVRQLPGFTRVNKQEITNRSQILARKFYDALTQMKLPA
jgi:hypothetical protein